ncbi:MAG TPA: hypothetical protein VMT89_04870, partial [Candidatus Acidoferrales bacterium]|nr:hypothetical protein [Candidatus Acidoferrales bacterium]
MLMLFGGALGFAASSVAATVRQVSTAGTDSGDCSSSACLTISYAVGQAVAGDTVSVGAGTYTENVTITKSLTMQGAQAGVDARGRVASETIVSPTIAGTGTFILNTTTTSTVIDGFSFTGGTSLGVIQTQLGSLYSNLQIVNNSFSGYSGAAVFLQKAGLDITIDRN